LLKELQLLADSDDVELQCRIIDQISLIYELFFSHSHNIN
jgi:hypothetical protein